MAKKTECKHYYTFWAVAPDGQIYNYGTAHRAVGIHYVLRGTCNKCSAAYVFGSSWDAPDEVQVEMHAAELSAAGAWESIMTSDENTGWARHLNNKPDDMIWWPQLAGWLSREILTHCDREARDVDAWDWSPAMPLAGQRILIVEPATTGKLILTNEDSNSLAANRFLTGAWLLEPIRQSTSGADRHHLVEGNLLVNPTEDELDQVHLAFAALVAERNELRARVNELEAKQPECAHCETNPATCFGSYDEQRPVSACDVCCGHGNEDGWCLPIEDLAGYASTIGLNMGAVADARDSARKWLATTIRIAREWRDEALAARRLPFLPYMLGQ